MKKKVLGMYRRAVFLGRLKNLPKQTHPLCIAAVQGLTGSNYPTKAGYCQMWVRLVLQAVFGHKFDFAWKSSARLAALAWAGSHYVVAPTEPLKPGDILYKTVGSGGFGHVGIYLLGGMVAENSSLHDDDDGDARGLRTLLEFGVYQIRVRPY